MNERNQRVAIMDDFFTFAKAKIKETDHFVYSLPNSQNKIDFSIVSESGGERFYRIEPIRAMPEGGTNSFGCFKVPTTDAVRLRNAIRESIHQLLFIERADKSSEQRRPSLASLIDGAATRAAAQRSNSAAPAKESIPER